MPAILQLTAFINISDRGTERWNVEPHGFSSWGVRKVRTAEVHSAEYQQGES